MKKLIRSRPLRILLDASILVVILVAAGLAFSTEASVTSDDALQTDTSNGR